MILVSACLIGMRTNFRGESWLREDLLELVKLRKAVPVCPEQLGGLATPRPPAEISGGDGRDVLNGNARVIRPNGEDVTEQFLRGAEETLRIAQLVIPDLIIFKDHSPSCGVTAIYDGSFTETLRNGIGVTTALLMRQGFKVVPDEVA